MTKIIRFIHFVFLCAAVLLLGCEECKDQKLTALLYPRNPDTVLSDTQIEYRELHGGITCSRSDFTTASQSVPPEQLVANAQAVAGNSEYGNYHVATALIRTDAAFNALQSAGCLNDLATLAQVDWTTQTMVILQVGSTSGCNETTTVQLQEDFNGLGHLAIDVHFTPNDTCEFEFARTILIDQAGAVAHFTLNAGCKKSNSIED